MFSRGELIPNLAGRSASSHADVAERQKASPDPMALPAAMLRRPSALQMNTNSRTLLTFVTVALIWAAPTGGQELGNKVLGTVGLLAGSQPSSGFYVADRFLGYQRKRSR
jgi:hypothetical protein